MQRAVKRRLQPQEQYKKLIHFRFCAPGQKGQIFAYGLGALRGIHASLKIKPHAGEWLAVFHCSDNRKCGLLLMFIQVVIKKASAQKYREKPERSRRRNEPLTLQQKRKSNRCAPPLVHLKPNTQTAVGSDLCNKPRLRQQGILGTISE